MVESASWLGRAGPATLQDMHLIEKYAHFNRERVPERVVHAKGAGVHGYLRLTDDVSDLFKENLFNKVWRKTPLFAGFSAPIRSLDKARAPRGFSVKFYSENGNRDMVKSSMPVLFVRDALKFADLSPSNLTRRDN